MPDLTQEENDWLKLLGSEAKLSLRTRELRQLSLFIHRLMNVADQAEKAKRKAELLANGFWLTASGKLDEQQINANPQLTEQERGDMLAMLQLRHDAVHWREHTGFDLPAIPSLDAATVTESISTLPSLNRSDD